MFDILNCVQSRALREYWHVMNYTPSFKECIYFIYHRDDISLNEKIEMAEGLLGLMKPDDECYDPLARYIEQNKKYIDYFCSPCEEGTLFVHESSFADDGEDEHYFGRRYYHNLSEIKDYLEGFGHNEVELTHVVERRVMTATDKGMTAYIEFGEDDEIIVQDLFGGADFFNDYDNPGWNDIILGNYCYVHPFRKGQILYSDLCHRKCVVADVTPDCKLEIYFIDRHNCIERMFTEPCKINKISPYNDYADEEEAVILHELAAYINGEIKLPRLLHEYSLFRARKNLARAEGYGFLYNEDLF
ncbi:MAG: hypothetical protein IKT04_01295 [Clostridia bacterium]|nr:hypothetical protein [Clostridia bacterium]